MSQIVYRGNLSSAFFPLISQFHGRTVIIPGPDNNFNRQLQSSADLDKDIGIPQMYYCHNVMPNGEGYQAVGYEQRVGSVDGTAKGITQELLLRDDLASKKGYFSIAPGGFYIILNELTGFFGFLNTYFDVASGTTKLFPSNLSTTQVTSAHVNGITYLYISGLGCFQFNFSTNTFTTVILVGLTPSAILGLTESNGYMIAYSINAVAWSSLITPTDFTPSLTTGSGGGNVAGIKGNITCGAPTSNGFILYTESNAIAVLYTGNSQFPFQFSECLGAGGVSSIELVTYDADSGYNYAYTSYGFQILKAKSAESTLPDLTDFLAGQYFEDFDDVNKVFSYQTLIAPLLKKLVFIANRYLIVSYGISELTHALIYDIVQKRFGKLKFTHVDCFQYDLLTAAVSDIPRKSIAFIKNDGSIYLLNFAIPFTTRNGTLLLGKYQYVRSRHLQLQEAAVEGPTPGGAFTITDFVSYDGKAIDNRIVGTVLDSSDDYASYGFGSPVGVNHSLLLQGAFNLTSVQLTFNIHGRM